MRNKDEAKVAKKDEMSTLKDEVDHLLVNEYVPAALLVNANLDVIIFRGDVSPYVLPESGLASLNLARKWFAKSSGPKFKPCSLEQKKKTDLSRKTESILFTIVNRKQSIFR